MEFYKTHRPKSLDDILGQPGILATLRSMIDKGGVPHTLLFTGPSGCGKTTLARIVSKALGARKTDLKEVNCADFRGVDMIRDLRQQMSLAPMYGKAKVWIIDESHKLTNDAQNAFLKLLEDTPDHVWIMLATTEPERLLKTIRTRCSEIAVKSLPTAMLSRLCEVVASKEGFSIDDGALGRLVELADGSARKALVLLEAISHVKSKEQKEALSGTLTNDQAAIDIARGLLAARPWSDIAKLLKGVENNDAEGIRHLVLAYATSVLLGGGPKTGQAALMLEEFRENFFDSRKPGLVLAAYRVTMTGK